MFGMDGTVHVAGICAVQTPKGEVLHAALSDGRVYQLVDGDAGGWLMVPPLPLKVRVLNDADIDDAVDKLGAAAAPDPAASKAGQQQDDAALAAQDGKDATQAG
jgi:hypothetical protein